MLKPGQHWGVMANIGFRAKGLGFRLSAYGLGVLGFRVKGFAV